MGKKMTKSQKREARSKIKKLVSLLTIDEKKRMRGDRRRKRVVNKSYRWMPRSGIKEWVLSQKNLKNIEQMKKLGLLATASVEKEVDGGS